MPKKPEPLPEVQCPGCAGHITHARLAYAGRCHPCARIGVEVEGALDER